MIVGIHRHRCHQQIDMMATARSLDPSQDRRVKMIGVRRIASPSFDQHADPLKPRLRHKIDVWTSAILQSTCNIEDALARFGVDARLAPQHK